MRLEQKLSPFSQLRPRVNDTPRENCGILSRSRYRGPLRLPAFPTSVVFDNERATARLPLPHSVLLECLHLDSEKPDSAILASLSADDWRQLEALATQGSVRFQLYQRLQQPLLRSAVPTALLERLQAAAHEQTLRVLGLEATLVEILKACAAKDLPVMTLKGMHLAHAVYEGPFERDMADVDLLFRPADMARATNMFKSLGYRILHNADNLVSLAPANNEYTLVHPRLGTCVDVHWSLTRPQKEAAIDEPALWSRARALTISGAPTLTLSREDLLAYTCFHASNHHYFAAVGLRPFVDIARICARGPEPDWGTLANRVRKWGWERGTWLTLSMARKYFGAPVPEATLTGMMDGPLDRDQLHETALTLLFLGSNPEARIENNIVRLWSSSSHWARLRLLIRRLFPPRGQLVQEFGLSAYPALASLPFLYLRRIAGLLRRHGPKLWALQRADSKYRSVLASQRRLIAWLDAPDHR